MASEAAKRAGEEIQEKNAILLTHVGIPLSSTQAADIIDRETHYDRVRRLLQHASLIRHSDHGVTSADKLQRVGKDIDEALSLIEKGQDDV